MIKTTILVVALLICIVGAQAQTTEDAIQAYNNAMNAYDNAVQQMKRSDLRAQKREIIQQAISITSEQSRGFWSIYDKYEAETVKINDTRPALIQDYLNHRSDISAEKAAELINKIMQVQQERHERKRSYIKELGTVLTAKQALRLLLLEKSDRCAAGSADRGPDSAAVGMPRT